MNCHVTRTRFYVGICAAIFSVFVAPAVSAQQNDEVPDPHADVLSIGGSVTEIIAALGQQHRLKARDTTSSYPPGVTNLPDVGYMRSLSPEVVLSVGPSLILSEEGAGPPEALDVIRSADIPFVEVPEAYSAAGIVQKVRIVGDALGLPERAQALADTLEVDLAAAMARAGDRAEDPRRVLFVLSTEG